MSALFAHGDLRLYLLKLLEDEPRHGYELIRLLEDRFMGMYTPSAGTVYPRLAALEEDGLVEHEEIDGRKVYRITPAGRVELQVRADEIDELESRVSQSARDVARDVERARDLARSIRDEVRESVRDLRREVRDAAREVRRDQRRTTRATRTVHRAGPDIDVEMRSLIRSLQHDLEAFVRDVLMAARQHRLDRDRLRQVQEALLDSRQTLIDAFAGRRDSTDTHSTESRGDDEPGATPGEIRRPADAGTADAGTADADPR